MFNTRAFHQFLDRGHHLPGKIPTGLASLRYSVTQESEHVGALEHLGGIVLQLGKSRRKSSGVRKAMSVAYSPSCTDQ